MQQLKERHAPEILKFKSYLIWGAHKTKGVIKGQLRFFSYAQAQDYIDHILKHDNRAKNYITFWIQGLRD